MKKLLGFFAIIAIVLSVTFLYSCEDGSVCSQDQCSSCPGHIETETTYINTVLPTQIIISPNIIGHIFFTVINIAPATFVFPPDRPPASAANLFS